MTEISKKTNGEITGGQAKNPEPSAAATGRGMVWQAIGFAWDFGIMVVVPLVVLGVGGRYLDQKLDTSPWLFLVGAVVAIIISSILVVTRLSQLITKDNKQSKQ
ncbi:MAG: AtpZ/AtpI family protein [Candidatus Kerfeldbacteria bacterium]|nr:AtpZ/AtpI family protein [Candidatus Kerfeldbacteria bacterium]